MDKKNLSWKDLSLSDFKVYFLSLFKALIPKSKIKTLDELKVKHLQFLYKKKYRNTQEIFKFLMAVEDRK